MTAKERFLKYVRYDTTSNEESETFPSTDAQLSFLKLLKDELLEMGIPAEMDEHGYVMAKIAANTDSKSKIAFISHVDTSPAVSGKVSPKTIVYGGGDIVLESGEIISVKDNPALSLYVGEEIITSDGTSLLGADDKAGVAEIMTLAETLIQHPKIQHGTIKVGFTPDEEIGRGVEFFDVKKFGADFAYTMDGGELGELAYENFNAAGAVVKVTGLAIHPGASKNKMKSAVKIAMEFESLLPAAEKPMYTEGYEGFTHLIGMTGTVAEATMQYIIRDHDTAKFEAKKAFLLSAQDFINAKYGEGTCEVNIQDSYFNMKKEVEPHMFLIDLVKEVYAEMDIRPLVMAIRGGTDGATLSYMGLPCPNLGTGDFNCHGPYEYVNATKMEQAVEMLVRLSEKFGKLKKES